MTDKDELRATMRRLRREHVASLPQSTRALLFLRPPAPVAALTPEGGVVGLYHASGAEAPTTGYARWFSENGRRVALPFFAAREEQMEFRIWNNPHDDAELEPGPYGALQPGADSEAVIPDTLFVPVIGFTAKGARLGQGGGHYDRWLADHPRVDAIGLAWDCQHLEALPIEPHDRFLRAVVTPTRFYQGD